MIKKITHLIATNLPLKLLSLICGYLVWSMVSQSHVVTNTYAAPVCVYNDDQHQHITTPESIMVTLQAVRHKLYSIDTESLAIHIDASALRKGDNQLIVDRSTLFLPDGINVVHYSPSNAVITLTEKI